MGLKTENLDKIIEALEKKKSEASECVKRSYNKELEKFYTAKLKEINVIETEIFVSDDKNQFVFRYDNTVIEGTFDIVDFNYTKEFGYENVGEYYDFEFDVVTNIDAKYCDITHDYTAPTLFEEWLCDTYVLSQLEDEANFLEDELTLEYFIID